MDKFFYPQDYLKVPGNIKHCWELHRERMKLAGLPYVGYAAFYYRLTKYNWSLFKSIHTPLDYSKLEWNEKAKVWIRTQRFRFIYLIKRYVRRRRSKRH